MKKITITAIGIIVLSFSFSSFATTGRGLKILGEKITSTLGFNFHVESYDIQIKDKRSESINTAVSELSD